jgi:hypothetical protein
MNQIDRALEIIATYRRHGWQLRRVLMTRETRAEANEHEQELFEDAQIDERRIDALWFSRPSHQKREAWELRLVGETPYALFEAFSTDEPEEQRDKVRHEMEQRMRDYAGER